MKKSLFLKLTLVLFLLISGEIPSYGASDFTKLYNKGLEFYKQGKYDQAGQEFEKAIELKPNDVYALYGLGNTYYCKAKYDEAVKIYARAIKINPDYAKVHYSLSLAYSKLGMTKDAEKEKAIFRELSQGEKGSRTTRPGEKTAPSDERSGEKSRFDDALRKVLDQEKSEEKIPARVSGEQQKQEAEDREVQRAQAERRTSEGGDVHSIFKGYTTEENPEVKPRVFTRRFRGLHGISNPLDNISLYIQEKWSKSGLNKIWICTAGYIFATQIWLCVVTLFVLIIWRIREKV